MNYKRTLEIGGFISGAVLIAFGVVVIALAVSGRNTVNSSLKQEQITGTPDMTPALITTEATKAGLDASKLPIPTCSVAGLAIDNGSRARCFAQYMRIHALDATHGVVYSQMGMYLAKPSTPKAQLTADGATDNAAYAQVDPKTEQPIANGARNTWVTYTALTTALNMSYFATQFSLFSVVVGVALFLTGVGFVVLDWAALHRRRQKTATEATPSKVAQPRRTAIA